MVEHRWEALCTWGCNKFKDVRVAIDVQRINTVWDVQWSHSKVAKTGGMFSHGKISRNRNSEYGTFTVNFFSIEPCRISVPALFFSWIFYCKELTTQTQNINTRFNEMWVFAPQKVELPHLLATLEWLHCSELKSLPNGFEKIIVDGGVDLRNSQLTHYPSSFPNFIGRVRKCIRKWAYRAQHELASMSKATM